MTQEPLFKDLSANRLVAIAADVDAAGGEKIVGAALWPKLSPDTAARKMSNALNPKQRHDLSHNEVWVIKQLARDAVGRSRVVEFECGELQADVKWLSKEDIKAKRKKRRAMLMAELIELESEDE
jgi:hypothetical protein